MGGDSQISTDIDMMKDSVCADSILLPPLVQLVLFFLVHGSNLQLYAKYSYY